MSNVKNIIIGGTFSFFNIYEFQIKYLQIPIIKYVATIKDNLAKIGVMSKTDQQKFHI